MCQQMPCTCGHTLFMSKTVQIKNIEINFYLAFDTLILYFILETIKTSNYCLLSAPQRLPGYCQSYIFMIILFAV